MSSCCSQSQASWASELGPQVAEGVEGQGVGELGSSPSPTWLSWTVDAGRGGMCIQIFYLLYPHL